MIYRSRIEKPSTQRDGENPKPYHGRRMRERLFAKGIGITRKAFLKLQKRQRVANLKANLTLTD